MTLKIYHYPACSTCRKALSFLRDHGIAHESINIVETPPSRSELLSMGKALEGELKKLFNTSGELYRQLGMKDRLSSMTDDEIVDLLASHGKLVKRPFVVSSRVMLVGFREEEWREAFGVSS